MAEPWVLGIDVGTTWTAAASYRSGRVDIVALGTNQSPSVPTIVFRQPGQPPLVTQETRDDKLMTSGGSGGDPSPGTGGAR